MNAWDQKKAAALKILGKTAKLPKERANISTAEDKFVKLREDFNAGREDLEKKLVVMQTAADEAKRGAQQYIDLLESDDFGLDEKKEEDKGKIDEARKLLTDYLNETLEGADSINKVLDTLDRALTDMSRLKDVKI